MRRLHIARSGSRGTAASTSRRPGAELAGIRGELSPLSGIPGGLSAGGGCLSDSAGRARGGPRAACALVYYALLPAFAAWLLCSHSFSPLFVYSAAFTDLPLGI